MLPTFSFTAPYKMSNLHDLRVSFQHDSQFDACRPVPLDLVALFDGVGPAPPVARDMIRVLLASAPEGEKRDPSLYQRTLPDWCEVDVPENQVPIPAAVWERLVKELEGIRVRRLRNMRCLLLSRTRGHGTILGFGASRGSG